MKRGSPAVTSRAASTRCARRGIKRGEELGTRRHPTAEEEVERRARALLEDPDLLPRVCQAMEDDGYAGDPTPALLAYIALTSRFMERPINLAFVADSSAGKNRTIEAALRLVPPEAVYLFSAGSPTSILYTDEDFRHRVVVFKEADSIPDNGPAASAVRALADDNVLRYEVTILNRQTGKFQTQTLTKPGPTGLITTSTRTLRRQLNTRVLKVPVADSEEATRQVMLLRGKWAAGGAPPKPDIEAFLALQRWLARGEQRVIVPFGEVLAELMSRTEARKPTPERAGPELRMRRDFEKLLSCVKTLACLHQRQRQQAPGGEIVATIDDYEVARRLLAPSFEATAAESVTRAIRETVTAIGDHEQDISETELARRLELTKQAISWRVTRALKKRWLVNEEPRSGKPYRLRRGIRLPDQVAPLPKAGDVDYALEGVPAPGGGASAYYFKFASTLAEGWPGGVTVAEWAARVKRESEGVRRRFDALSEDQLLLYDATTDRYGLPAWVREHLDATGQQGGARDVSC